MSEQLAQVQQESLMNRAADRVAGIGERLGDAVFGTISEHPAAVAKILGVSGVIMGLAPSAASANETVGQTTITEQTGDTIVHIGKSNMSESDFSAVTVMTNDRTISKAEVKRLKGAGDCQVFNGNKVKIYTDGHVEGGGVAPGRDHRKSLFCHETNGSGWFRAACGNAASINITPPQAIENVIWAGNKLKFRVTTRASATAEATCQTSDGLASAASYGQGSGFATEKLRVRTGAKADAKGQASKLINETKILASGQAKSGAAATAVAVCVESGGTVVPPTPKNGTEGPGAGTPGQPGGPGTPGQPGNPTEGAPCYDDNSTTNGDQNTATSGDILYGTPDQFGNCVGPAQPMQNA